MCTADKRKLQQKAKELGISLANMVRSIILEKYQNLTIGYVNPNAPIIKHDVEIRSKKKSQPPKQLSEKHRAMTGLISDLKVIFRNNINFLEKMEDAKKRESELGLIKSDEELKKAKKKAEERMILRQKKQKKEDKNREEQIKKNQSKTPQKSSF